VAVNSEKLDGNELGLGIRAIRLRRGWRQLELAREAGLSASTLSQIEHGIKDPSINSLRRIAKALGVPIFRFLADETSGEVVVRRRARPTLAFPDSNLVYEMLTPDMSGVIEMFFFRMGPGGVSGPRPQSHPGDECSFILSGSMEMEIEGRSHLLRQGDSIYIRSGLRHRCRTLGRSTVTGVSAISPAKF